MDSLFDFPRQPLPTIDYPPPSSLPPPLRRRPSISGNSSPSPSVAARLGHHLARGLSITPTFNPFRPLLVIIFSRADVPPANILQPRSPAIMNKFPPFASEMPPKQEATTNLRFFQALYASADGLSPWPFQDSFPWSLISSAQFIFFELETFPTLNPGGEQNSQFPAKEPPHGSWQRPF